MGTLSQVLATPVVDAVPLLAVLLLAVPLTAVLSRHPLRLVGLGGAMVYSLDSAVLALLLWTTAPAVAAGAVEAGGTSGLVVALVAWLPWIAGYVVAEASATARRPVVRAYNIALSALAGAVFVGLALGTRTGTALLVTGQPAPPGVGVWDLLAVITASAGYVLTDLVLSACFVARVEHCSVRQVLADPAGFVAAGSALAVNATAVLVALLLTLAPWALLLLAPVAVALVLSTRTSTTALTEHARAQALYRGAEGCQSATTRDAVVDAVLAATRDAASAPAELRATPPAPGQVGAPVDDEDGRRWLVTGPRGNRQPFDRDDGAAVATLAALATQSLARVGAMDRIRHVAERDALTGVLNRGAFLDLVARSATPSSAVLFCDVDHFKSVNDTFGHRVGDEVLVRVSSTLRDVVGDAGVVGRIGGDEFVVLLVDTDPGRTDEVRSTVLAATEPPFAVADRDLRVGLSIGVAAVTDLDPAAAGRLDRDQLAEALLEQADRRMYADKRSSRPQPVGTA